MNENQFQQWYKKRSWTNEKAIYVVGGEYLNVEVFCDLNGVKPGDWINLERVERIQGLRGIAIVFITSCKRNPHYRALREYSNHLLTTGYGQILDVDW